MLSRLSEAWFTISILSHGSELVLSDSLLIQSVNIYVRSECCNEYSRINEDQHTLKHKLMTIEMTHTNQCQFDQPVNSAFELLPGVQSRV